MPLHECFHIPVTSCQRAEVKRVLHCDATTRADMNVFHQILSTAEIFSPRQLQISLTSSHKLTPVSLHKDKEYDQWQNIRHINSCPFRELDSFSCICLFTELLPSPAIAARTEQKVNQTAKWEQIITYNKIFQIQYITSCSKWLESAQYIEARMHGRERITIAIRFITTAFALEQLVRSIANAMIFSKTAMTVDAAAKSMHRKNKVPQILPPLMELKIFGSVIKIRLGPLSG